MAIPVLIDADVGVDDAVAICLATSSAAIELTAVVGVGGSVPLDQVMVNIERVLGALHLDAMPRVGRGLDQSSSDLKDRRDLFGDDGLGNFDGPSRGKVTSVGFLDAYAQAADAAGGELNILTSGPLTNLAAAITIAPDLRRSIKQVYVCGGAVWAKGNVSNSVEFNFYRDPQAAAVVLSSGLPVTVVPLDVTGLVCLDQSHVAHLAASDRLTGQVAAQILEYSLDLSAEPAAGKTFAHGAVAAGAMIWPELFMGTRMRLDITTVGSESGRTRPRLGGDKSQHVSLLTAVNSVDFIENLLESLCQEAFIV
jgi:purine nucleosidase